MNPMNKRTRFLFVTIFLCFTLILFWVYPSPSSIENPSYVLETHNRITGDFNSCCANEPPCRKIPSAIAESLIHYATSNTTPQQTEDEISVAAWVLANKSPCNFLVFGLGHDSIMWRSLNYGGKTVFLEEDEAWIDATKRRFSIVEVYHVAYNSMVKEAETLMEVGRRPECMTVNDPRHSMCQLALKGLPTEVYETEWDAVMLDAPTGYHPEAPGRMTAIYTVALMARLRGSGETDVFVHDVDREVEDKFSRLFLCEGYVRRQEGKLRHFTIPTHINDPDMPFCPA